VPKSVPF